MAEIVNLRRARKAKARKAAADAAGVNRAAFGRSAAERATTAAHAAWRDRILDGAKRDA